MPSVRVDPFFTRQPPLLFVEELKQPLHREKPYWFGSRKAGPGEIWAGEAYLCSNFPDEEGLLQTAFSDFDRFLTVFGIQGTRYPIRLVEAPTDRFEAYRIRAEQEQCVIEAADTEGIRRALVFLEDEMCRREGAILPARPVSRKPVIRARITRGFFSPTNRPPKNIDELMDDVDYYPDAYLNRLAHDGTNGIWIYTYFSQLLPSRQFPEFGADSARRIAKLRRVVEKCRRYGIRVWIFGVEPFALSPEMAAKYPDAVGGVSWNGRYSVCTHSRRGADYCTEVTQRLMELVPELGGIIDITYGERPSSCGNSDHPHSCPRCRAYSRSTLIAHAADLMKEGIRRAGSRADFVSWTYEHRHSTREEITEYVQKAPQDVVLMENFEDNGYVSQLDKTRVAIDYWLSYTGPSQMFIHTAETALALGKPMFAKMQVCCSHELASVPYIPVPGILFDKYAAARKYRVEGVMQCWYFGNYPSLMSKAAGELSFMEDFSDKAGFLRHLAGIYCGTQAEQLVDAWDCFERGYRNYPVNIMFSYYGPMHDGVVWDLALLPRDTSLPRSWQLMDTPDGDRIGECLQAGHTLEEAITLTGQMIAPWKTGLAALPEHAPEEMCSVASALLLLMESGHRILRFYALRNALGYGTHDANTTLEQMAQLAQEEIRGSLAMADLCRKDPRLGYHSEAEGYKFFPEKLLDRVDKLRLLLATEFPQVRQRLAAGQPPLDWYRGAHGYALKQQPLDCAAWETVADQGRFRMAYDRGRLYVELQGSPNSVFRMHFEFQLLWPAPGIKIHNGVKSLSPCALSHQSVWGEKIHQELDKYTLLLSEPENGHYILAISREKAGWTSTFPLRVMLAVNDISWRIDDDPVHSLGKDDISPGEFGWLIPEPS